MTQEAEGKAAAFTGPSHGEFCWTEIASGDSDKCKAFYTNVFGWKFKKSNASDGEFAYDEFSTNSATEYPAGGLYQISPAMCGEGELPPPHFLTYVAVDDVDEYAAKAAELGGNVIKGPDDIPNTGRFAILSDPGGAMFAIFKMNEDGGHNG